MNLLKGILSFYRVRDWIKNLGFLFISLTIGVSPSEILLLFCLGIVQGIFLFSFLFSFNDFGDHIVNNEKNFIGYLMDNAILSKNIILFLYSLPLILSTIPLIFNTSMNYLIFYGLFIIISIAYSAPRIRLRDLPIIDIICNVLIFTSAFFLSYFFVNPNLVLKTYFFLLWVSLYVFSHEILHQISDFEKDRKSGRNSTIIRLGKKKSISFFKFTISISLMSGLVIFFAYPTLRILSGIMILFSSIRFFYFLRFDEKSDFRRSRNRLDGIIEGSLYFILNLLKV